MPSGQQRAAAVLMVRPAHLFVDPETAQSNLLQTPGLAADRDTLARARAEFDRLAQALELAGVRVCVLPAPAEPVLPDAVFPNNWISTHEDGTVVLYPMLAARRRLERDPRVLEALRREFGFGIARTVDLSYLEARGEFVEGTGSLVLDHRSRLAYAALSPRTTRGAVDAACAALGFRAIVFHARHGAGPAIYHTNVMLAIGTEIAVGCFEAIRDPQERERVLSSLRGSGRTPVTLTEAQMLAFAANCLELDARGQPLLVLSTRAWTALDGAQRRTLERAAGICSAAVDTIESVGGGSVRCMLAEIFLPPAGPALLR